MSEARSDTKDAMRAWGLRRQAAALACAALAAASAGGGRALAAEPPAEAAAASPGAGDPWEPFNRSMYRFGMGLDHAVARPLAHGYMSVTPPPARRGIHNVLQNLDEPVVFLNDLLQLRPNRAARTAGRFLANSTLGLAGLFDIAAKNGHPRKANDFGATLAHYGVGAGPYLFVPLLGPSNVRDLTGRGVDFVADPFWYARYDGARAVNYTRTGVGLLDQRASVDADLEAVQRTAADPYATIRSVYNQHRAAELSDGRSAIENLPDIPDENGTAAAPEPPK
jgi:phospholipid-binding lipoprotein MlaA